MEKLFVTGLFLIGVLFAQAQDVYVCRNVSAGFFSSAPIENIEARTDKGFSALNKKEGTVYFKIPVSAFVFKNSLMQEHFNENYMESQKYPYAEFSGRILPGPDPGKEGRDSVTIQGNLTVHGVTRPYRVAGILMIKEGKVQASAEFTIRLADHRIRIPSLLFRNIAETVAVKINAIYIPNR
jgi:polyisoprenoid-binding protein YceI